MKYIPLAEDLTKLLEGFEKNPLITENQRRIWKAEGKKKAISHGMLGKDHPNALRLLKEDGYDGKPVGSLSKRSAESFWYYTDNHVFPPEDDLIRLGIFMHLDLYRLLALVLKGKWEEFFAREVCGWRANVGKNLAEILQDEEKMEEALNRFNPDTGPLHWRLLSHGNVDMKNQGNYIARVGQVTDPLAELVDKAMERMRESGVRWLVEAGYTPESFDTLVQRMLLQRLHWVATDSPEIEHFTRKAVEEAVIWSLGTEEERREYWTLQQAWLQLKDDLGETHLMIESVRLQNARVHYRYLQLFGQYELDLMDLEIRRWELEQKIALKRTNPELSAEELEKAVEEEREKREKARDDLSDDVVKAGAVDPTKILPPDMGGGWGIPVSERYRAAYIEECKKLIAEIRYKTHPKNLERHPNYEKLTPEQKEELAQIFAAALKVKPGEVVYPSNYLESRFRSPAELRRILNRIDEILEQAGINLNPELEVKGETLPDRLAWLREEIKDYEEFLEEARLELQSLLQDEEIAKKRAILANEASHEEVKAEFEKQIERLKKEVEELEAELAELLGGEAK